MLRFNPRSANFLSNCIRSTTLVSKRFELQLSEENIEDVQQELIRKKATRKQYMKKTNKELGKPYSYAWRYPSLRFTKHFHAELKSLYDDGKYDELFARWSKLRAVGKHPSPFTVEFMVKAYTETNQSSMALEVLKTIENDTNNVTRNTFRYLAAGFIREGNFEGVDEAFRLFKNTYYDEDIVKYNGCVFGAYIAHFIKEGNEKELNSWLEKFKKEKYTHLKEYESFLTELSSDYLRNNRNELVTLLGECGLENNIINDLITYQFAKRGLLEDVENQLDVLKKENSVDAEIYDSLILAQVKNSKIDDALNTLNVLTKESMEITADAYCDLIRICAEEKRDEDVQRLLVEMNESGHDPTRRGALVSLIDYFADKKDVEMTKKYWNIAQSTGALTNPEHSHKAIALLAEYSPPQAYEMFLQLHHNHVIPLEETFNVLINAYKGIDLVSEAKHLEQHKFRSYH